MAGIMAGIFLVLSVLGYLLYAAIMGGKYCMIYSMDDAGILQEQQPRQATSERENSPSPVVSLLPMPSSSMTAAAMLSAPLT